MLDFRLL